MWYVLASEAYVCDLASARIDIMACVSEYGGRRLFLSGVNVL